jgi:hypothetical protein
MGSMGGRCQPNSALVGEGHVAVGVVALYRGDLITARAQLEQSLELYASQPPSISIFAGGLCPKIASLVWLARALWVLGYADQAQQRGEDTMALARQTEHAPSIAYAEYILTHHRATRTRIARPPSSTFCGSGRGGSWPGSQMSAGGAIAVLTQTCQR